MDSSQSASEITSTHPSPTWLRLIQFLVGAGIVALGAIIRVLGLHTGLPYTYNADEPNYVIIAQTIFKTGDLNLHFFFYPSVFFYLNTLAYIPYYYLGRLLGLFQSLNDLKVPEIFNLGIGYTELPSTFILGRGITVLFGVGAILIVLIMSWKITRRRAAAFVGALLLALSATHIEYSRYIVPHAIFTTMLLAAFWACYKVMTNGQARYYWLAAALCGLSISTMYHGVVILLTLCAAHFLRLGVKGIRDGKLYLALGLSLFIFLVLNPFSFLEPTSFAQDSSFIIRHYLFAIGGNQAAGMGNAFPYYFNFSWSVEGPLLIFAAIEFLRGLMTRQKASLLLSSFAAPYFVLICSAMARNTRTFLPLIPFLILMTALLLSSVLTMLARQPSLTPTLKRVLGLGLIAALLVCFIPSTAKTFQTNLDLLTTNSREEARVWVEETLPANSKIALESYAPYIDSRNFVTQAFFRLIDHPPDWYVSNQFDYLIFSQGMFKRFYDEPEIYKHEISEYEDLFRRFELLKTFDDGHYEIRIYRAVRPSVGHARPHGARIAYLRFSGAALPVATN